MIAVVGLGKAGCDMAEKFSSYPQYDVYKVYSGKGKSTDRCLIISRRKTPEEYEEKSPSFKKFLGKIKERVLFIVDGSEVISACSLRLLHCVKDCQVEIMYIQPDVQFLSGDRKLNERAVRGVLQEYTRSAVFERMYLVNVPTVAAAIGDIPIKHYHDRVYQMVVSAFHMLNVFTNSEPIISNLHEPVDMARISTFGLVDPETDEEKMFFPLDFPRERYYYYGINEEKLNTDGSLMGKIKERISSVARDDMKVSYAIYETKYENDYIYIAAHSSMIQQIYSL